MRDRLLSILIGGIAIFSYPNIALAQVDNPNCPAPALERFVSHKVASGETLESIAQSYNLIPATIINMNPVLKNSKPTVGNQILIPPYDGIIVQIPKGQTWRQVAAKHKIRADALFEVNGCQQNPTTVFVPKQVASVTEKKPIQKAANDIRGYPLPQVTTVTFPYGWQINPNNGDVFFHSGIDLLANTGTPVQAISSGTVVFAEEQGTYGNLVIVNHGNQIQSRYAHLNNIKVSVGDKVNPGDSLGEVGTTGTPTVNKPHLHFEIRSSSDLGWVALDPKAYLTGYIGKGD